MYKKAAKRPGLAYLEALDEALCFGWIDGQLRAVDEERYRQRWTPRRKRSNWSEQNKQKVRKLTAAERMAGPGLAEVRAAKKDGRWSKKSPAVGATALPFGLWAALKADPKAMQNFEAFAPSYRRMYIGWVREAKTDMTRKRRIEAVVRRSRDNRKPGIESMYD